MYSLFLIHNFLLICTPHFRMPVDKKGEVQEWQKWDPKNREKACVQFFFFDEITLAF